MSQTHHADNTSKENIYKILDQVVETGTPAKVILKGKVLLISPTQTISKFDLLEEHPGYLIGDSEELVHIDWSSSWEPHL
jgi:hypothetical protein